ncbi:MAG: NADH pyrophosphatase, partial [Afipia sp.]|nr:NADH pyrophosphatase [Afipia sp.]
MTTKENPFPLGQPGFVSHPIDRAAHIRTDAEKLFALETHRDARAYVVHRDSLVVTLGADGPRALLTLEEAHKFGANPGTIFLGLHEGAAIFGMG